MIPRRFGCLAAAAMLVLVAGCGSTPGRTGDVADGISTASPAVAAIPPEELGGAPVEAPAVVPLQPSLVPTDVPAGGPGASYDPGVERYAVDYCLHRDWLTPYRGYDDAARTVVDPTYTLPVDYVPPDLVAVSSAGIAAPGAVQVRQIVIGDLTALRAAADAVGAPLEVLSAYRSYAQQEATFNHWVSMMGYDLALGRAARPGHSEHQLGTSLDFSSPGWAGRFGDWALESPSGAWMAAHAWEFGFVMSFPNGGELATCYGYEPWHYRWIGRDAAAGWRDSGLTLHEFLVGETQVL